jgi:hypothetical protein
MLAGFRVWFRLVHERFSADEKSLVNVAVSDAAQDFTPVAGERAGFHADGHLQGPEFLIVYLFEKSRIYSCRPSPP